MSNQKAVLASQISVKLGGSEVDKSIIGSMLECVVDQHSHLPDMFTIRLHDPDLTLLDSGPFDLAKEIEISGKNEGGSSAVMLKGEITALEPCFKEGKISEFVVRGYDKSHRLYRETKSKAFLNIKDSDLASQIAGSAGLSPEVEATSTVYDHIYQHNQTDMDFLTQRAWRIGYECFASEGKLVFRKPPESGSGPTLTWGEDLLSFYPRVTLAEQVDEVIVKGWDVAKQEAIVGQASKGILYPKISEGPDKASEFGTGKMIVVDQPVVSQSEANILAEARINELSGAFVQAEGVAFRRPEVKAGETVKLEGLGSRLSGTYLVTNAVHTYREDGLSVRFKVSGSRSGSIAEQMNSYEPLSRWPGVVVGIVTNTDDPEDWGRVKLKYPWMTEDAESDWARVVCPGAGSGRGMFVMPHVGDEVMVAFEHGVFNRPIILGGTWNGKSKIPGAGGDASTGEKPQVRSMQSEKGHTLTMYDNADNRVEVTTASGHSVTVDDKNKWIEIKTSGGLVVKMEDDSQKITIEAGQDIIVKAGKNLDLEAGAAMSLKAAKIDIKGSGPVTVKGNPIKLN